MSQRNIEVIHPYDSFPSLPSSSCSLLRQLGVCRSAVHWERSWSSLHLTVTFSYRFIYYSILCRSLITCTIPGINLLYCMGPRVQAVKSSETVYGRRPYLRNGLHNGVDLRWDRSTVEEDDWIMFRFLKMMGLQRKTEIGRTIGAGVAIGPKDGEVEFGDRYDLMDLWTMNRYCMIRRCSVMVYSEEETSPSITTEAESM